MKKIALLTAMILMLPAMCLANYKITYVEYYTPDKPGPPYQRLKVVVVNKYIIRKGMLSLYFPDYSMKIIRSPYIDIEKIDEVEKGD